MRGFALNHSIGFGEGEKLERVKPAQVSLIRHELVTLTGNHSHAVILNQLLYWTQRTKDFSYMTDEERTRSSTQEEAPQYGWIYKTADELIEETLLQVDRTTIRRHLNYLVKQGWLFERSNPQNKWDRTTQYRVNVRKVQKDLMSLGFILSEISLWRLEDLYEKGHASSSGHNDQSNVYTLPLKRHNTHTTAHHSIEQVSSKSAETSNGRYAHSNGQLPLKPAETSSGHYARSNGHNARSSGQFARCNTETTTEITNKEHTTHAQEFQNEFLEKKKEEGEPSVSPPHPSSCPVQTMVVLWEQKLSQRPQLTEKRKQLLTSLLEGHFQNDLSQWKTFCERIKASPFLMGEGSRRWRVSLDWILIEENLLKVLEGNFDDSVAQERQESKHLQNERTKEILNSIIDPQWKEWCTLWAQGIWLNESQVVIEPLSCSDLERIANARFLEVEDERLVWIGSTDQAVLNKIESLRLPLYSIISRTFPNSRTLRTRLIETPQTNQPQQTTEGKTSC